MAYLSTSSEKFPDLWLWFQGSTALLTVFYFPLTKNKAVSPLKQQAEMMEGEKLDDAEEKVEVLRRQGGNPIAVLITE